MANRKNTFIAAITDKRTLPYNVTKQGTINTVGTNVQGSDGLTYNTLVGAIGIGNLVTGSTSKAHGVVYADSGTVLKLSDISGVFLDTEVLTFTNTLTGATTATAAVNGVPTYTLFMQQCVVGDFIYNDPQSEVHKITSISDNMSMQIQEAFGSDLTAQSLLIVPFIPHPKEISVLIPAGNPSGTIDGAAWPAGVGYTASKINQGMTSTGIGQFIDPIIVNATGTTMLVEINY